MSDKLAEIKAEGGDKVMASELATEDAAQCWCDPRTSDREMDVELATVFAERLDLWIETARQHAQNKEYYRGLLDQIGVLLGPTAYTSDDGSIQDEVLRAKLPALVASLRQRHAAEVEAAFQEACEAYAPGLDDDAIERAWAASEARRRSEGGDHAVEVPGLRLVSTVRREGGC